MNKEEFIESIKNLGINVEIENLNKLEIYANLLIDENKVINLTSIIDKEDIYLKHFYDSLCLIKIVDLTKNLKVCDIGSGGGFPGIVLKIFFPNLNITLVDSTKKKTDFLQKAIEKLDLKDIDVINMRIEDYANVCEEKYDLVVARALAKLNVLLELSAKLIKINGFLIAMKGYFEEELLTSNKTLEILNMRVEDLIEYRLPKDNMKRSLIKIKKIKQTPKLYPRNFSKIKKNPL